MTEKPLAIVLAAVIQNNKILLINRKGGAYSGLLALPGGKIEQDEFISEAAIREIAEESGITTTFDRYLGVVSEHLVEAGKVLKHFVLHVVSLKPATTTITRDDEGELDWYALDDLAQLKAQCIPSDYEMIQRMVENKEQTFYTCILEKKGEAYVLTRFA